MSALALISDLHANRESLEAIFADIDRRREATAVACLGDLVGYGPDPEAVIDLVSARCAWTLLGNHDFALLNAPAGFNAVAAGAILCQRSFMAPGVYAHDDSARTEKERRWDFLRNLPEEKWLGEDLFVHASPRDKIFEYILPTDPANNPAKLEKVFAMLKRHCFVGHTHVPGVITEGMRWLSEKDCGGAYVFRPGVRAIVNVSSAGQPRDRDPRACYAVLYEDKILWRRVAYDIDKTIRRVAERGCIDPVCGERLRYGK